MEATQGSPETSTSAVAEPAAGVDSSQLDIGSLTLAETEALFRGESVEVPLKSSGEGKAAGKPAAQAPKSEETTQELAGEPPASSEAAPETEEQVEVEAELEASGEAEGEPETESESEGDPEVESEIPSVDRPRLDDREQAIMGLYKHQKRIGAPITLAQAEATIDGLAQNTDAAAPPVDLAANVSALRDEVTEIEKKLAAFQDGLYTKEVSELTIELARKQGALGKAEAQFEAAQAAERASREAALQQSEANRTKAHAQAIAEYPDANNIKTPLGKAVAKEVAALKNPNHPDHQILFTDSCALTIARNVALRMGIPPKPKSATPPAAKTPSVPPPRKVVSPVPGSKGTTQASVQPAEDAKAQLELVNQGKVSLADMDAIQGLTDPAKLLAGTVR